VNETLQLLLALALFISAAKVMGLASLRLGQPAVLGELLAGLLLGPTLLDVFSRPLFSSPVVRQTVEQSAEIGVILLMFVAGLEVELEEIRRAGRRATLVGSLGVFTPLLLGALASLLFRYPLQESIFIGLILTATSVSISAQTLMELGFLRSKEGVTLLGAAVVDDVLAILLLAFFVALVGGSGAKGLVGIIGIVARMVIFLALGIVLALRLLPRLTSRVERLPVSESLMTWVVVVCLFFAWAAEALGGVAAITGAFLAGIAFSRTPYHQFITGRMHSLAYAFFVPLFFIHVGLQANGRTLGLQTLPFLLVIILVAVLSKVLGCGLGALLGGMTLQEALRVGVGMTSRGEVGLIIANVGLSAAIIDETVLSGVVIMVLVTTLITPPLLRAVFPAGRAAPVARRLPQDTEEVMTTK